MVSALMTLRAKLSLIYTCRKSLGPSSSIGKFNFSYSNIGQSFLKRIRRGEINVVPQILVSYSTRSPDKGIV